MTATAASTGHLPSETYRSQAGHYDQRTDAFRLWRELLVQRLPLKRGDTVLDVGCGTGLCLPLLQDKIGPTGAVIGVDASQAMLQVAADRCREHNWDNVQLIAAAVGSAPIDGLADAALFCAVHDVMQCPEALDNVVDHLRPGAPVAAAGGKLPGPWMWPFQAWVTDLHAPCITDFTSFDKPWRRLAEYVPDLQVRDLAFARGTSHWATPGTTDPRAMPRNESRHRKPDR